MPTLPDNQTRQINLTMSRADSSVPNTSEGLTEFTNGNQHQYPSSSTQYNFVESYPMFRVPVEQHMLGSYNLNGQSESVLKGVIPKSYTAQSEPNLEGGNKPVLSTNSGHPLLSLPFKRKGITGRTQDNQGPQKMSASNKRVAQMGQYPITPSASQVAAPKNTKASASGRKVMQIEPIKNESRSNASKKIVNSQVSPKGKTESQDSVRAKLKESLASALALVSQEQEGSPDGKMKIDNEVKEHIPMECPSNNGDAPQEPLKDGKSHVSSTTPTGLSNADDKTSLSFHSKEIFGEVSQTESFLGVLPSDDPLFSSGFYFKDEFLQGNGLSWESDLNIHIPKVKESEHAEKHVPANEYRASDADRKTVQSPESVALAIESELFNLFGGVNRKYKEKGRSLLFNLKDRNNPELRERVMSGELPPDRLCSMTAEELASKELSQWRIAKAEELDNMKVLPEPDINMRRLVKKTHKGEYQVDFEPDVGALEEIPRDIRVAPTKRSKIDKDRVPLKAEQAKADECEITIPSEGADMQGLMVDDLNDLPPVISLDEFMDSLNKDPPFENLPVDPLAAKGESEKENVELSSKSLSPVESQRYPVQKTSSVKVEVKKGSFKSAGDENLTGTPKRSDTDSANRLHKCESFWEGQLQLNLSSTANFIALYKSGEKASSREWASSFDIKGRVRYDAFDKFLQALPMSRSRAITVCHFALKESFTDSERASLKELVDSYIADERVGFAEPGNRGVELYLCPPRSKSVDMVVNHLPKTYTERLNDIDDGLIGIVVWRKVQITSAVSPVSSQHQPVTKKQFGGTNVDNHMNKNNVFTPKQASPPPILHKSQFADNDNDDDAPPGFGPPGTRVDDDLPEFHFSGGSHSSLSNSGRETGFQHHPQAPPLQAVQMRQLIQKYGQNGINSVNGSGIPTEPWNDDDDDIPEWQPQPAHNPLLPTHIPNHQPIMANHHIPSPWAQVGQMGQPLQPPMSLQHQRPPWGLYGPEAAAGLPIGHPYGSSSLGQPYQSPGQVSRYVANDRRSNASNNRNG